MLRDMGAEAVAEAVAKHHYSRLTASNKQGIRNQFYWKLLNKDLIDLHRKKQSKIPTFDFDFGSFFSLVYFLKELQRLADFLDMSFMNVKTLADLWKNFIEVNKGIQYYKRSNELLEHIIFGVESEVDDNLFIQAYINCQLTLMFSMHEGSMFEDEEYPNTLTIHNEIKKHIDTFDENTK
jgi:hypothetical protein